MAQQRLVRRRIRKPSFIVCRRATGGGPVGVFAALDEAAVTFTQNEGRTISVNPDVTRTLCAECGPSLTGRYDYLAGQVYISLGVINQAIDLAPKIHCHDSGRNSWLHIDDNLERVAATARSKIHDDSKSLLQTGWDQPRSKVPGTCFGK
ncbi:MAG: GFA family protein [Granulosicoccaceae bacterium]